MASKTITSLVDDLDGSEATETIRFALADTEYEIDLSDSNADRFRNSLDEFVAHARKVGRRRSKGSGSTRADKNQIAAMRQ